MPRVRISPAAAFPTSGAMRLTAQLSTLHCKSASRVSPLHDTLNMVRELLKIRRIGASRFYETRPQATADELPVA